MSRKNYSFKQLVLHTASLARTPILPMPSPLSRQTHATRQALRHNMAEGKAGGWPGVLVLLDVPTMMFFVSQFCQFIISTISHASSVFLFSRGGSFIIGRRKSSSWSSTGTAGLCVIRHSHNLVSSHSHTLARSLTSNTAVSSTDLFATSHSTSMSSLPVALLVKRPTMCDLQRMIAKLCRASRAKLMRVCSSQISRLQHRRQP